MVSRKGFIYICLPEKARKRLANSGCPRELSLNRCGNKEAEPRLKLRRRRRFSGRIIGLVLHRDFCNFP